ncbi:phenylalanine--tRNA ligase subunit alpha, partial [Candidatus Woesearchaeota archaeon]|nr:phenylalanine--tRNA ligase subunit alpha [Candidatus Woesearchaeota archaeon]
MEDDKLIQTLHIYERKVLSVIPKTNTLSGIAAESSLKEIEAMRGLQWLENKGIVKLSEDIKEMIDLDINGKRYLKDGLPEKRFLKAIKKDTPISQIIKDANLEKEEVNICLGVLRGKAAIAIKKENELLISSLPQAQRLLEKETLEERFLKKDFPVELKDLSEEERFAFESLKKRKNIIKIEKKKIKKASLTDLGKKLLSKGIKLEDIHDRLTPKMLKDGSWKDKRFRRYDVIVNVPKISGGRKQHYRMFLDDVRDKFLSLGFKEMSGPIVETEFWDMDALFMPQFHSARDIHAAYYVKEPRYGKVDEKLLEKVRESHEIGKGTISKGWQYKFDVNKTRQLILRTQGTPLSARMLASKDIEVPGKYFAIARCFRPDVVDATHSADFNQVEGIVVEENLDFRHLKGLLKMFAEEFGETDQIKITPAYFPFTEPSAELHAKHPELGWIELGGSGIFRPELVKPLLGREISVLAWGMGIDRLAMFKLGIKDIRELFSHSLESLRNS